MKRTSVSPEAHDLRMGNKTLLRERGAIHGSTPVLARLAQDFGGAARLSVHPSRAHVDTERFAERARTKP
ncbi:MAG: hypothetical protein DHS20C15_26060 [Planctomycetota bacterium]|nr:MAG: hypothetical protein DHS20C15_26060 [Planctomycetota bacterium]